MSLDDMPEMTCPRCGAEHPDFDGFGFVAHVKPAYPDGCGWCSHPARTIEPNGDRTCDICGVVETEAEQLADTICGARWVDGAWVHYEGGASRG